MISVLAQERVLGAALGAALASAIVFQNRISIYRTISENNAKFGQQPQIQKPVLEKQSQLDLPHLWNKGVDKTFGTLISSLSSRGW